MLRFEAVTRRFPDGANAVSALCGVDLTVDRGEFVAVMGPSGSGKTTLVNLAAGLDRADEGSVSVGGTDLGQLSASSVARFRRRHIGVVHQSDELDPLLDACDNVALPLLLDGRSRRSSGAAASSALRLCGVEDLAARFPDQLSGGQRQRVAVARAIVGDRRLVLADEPTASVDTTTARTLVQLLAQVAKAGAAVLITTHDSRLAAFTDRVVLLRDGRPVPDDSPNPTPIGDRP